MRFILSNTEKIDSTELIRQAQEAGLLDSNVTINCVHCYAVFPKEYDKCPQCEVNVLWKTVKIQYENYLGEKQN